MRNIIRLIQKYSNLLLFLLFQIIALFLLFSWRNSYHHSIYLNASNSLVGTLFETNNNILDYFKLGDINEDLKQENSKLKQLLFNSKNHPDYELSFQELLDDHQYVVKPLNIISSQFKQRENYLVIDKGQKDSIKQNMGIVGSKGVIGIVMNTSHHYASVMPIINVNFQLAIRHRRSKSFGMLLWNEKNNWKTAVVEDIPDYVKIYKGDIFESSGDAGIFPPGILIGKVEKTEKIPATQFQRIYLKLYEDYSSSDVGYVVINKQQNELMNIKEKIDD